MSPAATSRRATSPAARRLNFREACYELRRTGRLFEDGKITIEVWCESVHRILRAAGYEVRS